MALINTLRNKGGKIVVFIIGFSIVAFIAGDLLRGDGGIAGAGSNEIGTIAGVDIKYQDFLNKEKEMINNFQLTNNKTPSSQELNYLRNQTWDALISDHAYARAHNSATVKVSDEEIVDMVQGENLNPTIVQSFTNPQTGQFDKKDVIAFLQNVNNMPPAQQAQWYNFERYLGPGRLRIKYENLLAKSNYVSLNEARNEYMNSLSSANINYLYVPFYAVSDSVVKITESELKSYLSDHEDEYQREASKNIAYVSFDVVASAKDSAIVQEEVASLKVELEKSTQDSLFASVKSEGSDYFQKLNEDRVPSELKENDELLPIGSVVGPFQQRGNYVLYKLSGISNNGPLSAKASHILFKNADNSEASKRKAKEKALDVLKSIKRGKDFSAMAKLYGSDGTASRGGDLGWFSEGQMVKEFESAVFERSSTGLVPTLVESQFGYHIVEVTATKTRKSYNVAKLSISQYVSDETINEFYRQAEEFALNASTQYQFENLAEETGMKITPALGVGSLTRSLTGLREARNIVYWAYNTAKVGGVSPVFEIDNKYIIAVLTDEQEEGVANLESVRAEVTKKVVDAKKAEYISNKIEGLTGTLEEKSVQFGQGASFKNVSSLNLMSNSISGIGIAPEAVGVAFSLENGESTAPFAVSNGVVMIELIQKSQPEELADYDVYKNQILTRRQTKVVSNINDAVKELADIEDNRYKFF